MEDRINIDDTVSGLISAFQSNGIHIFGAENKTVKRKEIPELAVTDSGQQEERVTLKRMVFRQATNERAFPPEYGEESYNIGVARTRKGITVFCNNGQDDKPLYLSGTPSEMVQSAISSVKSQPKPTV